MMKQDTITFDRFSFPARELSSQLLEHIRAGMTGYWQYEFDRLKDRSPTLYWHLGIVDGRIVYTGNRMWSVQSSLRTIERYVVNTRTPSVKARLDLLKFKAEDKQLTPAQFLTEAIEAKILDDATMLKALRHKILGDLDIYLLMGSGEAKFVPEPDLAVQLPLAGFDAATLVDEALKRQLLWDTLKSHIPSMNLVPLLVPEMMAKAKISVGQQQRIENLVKSGKSLHTIAVEMARDPLEVADMFARLVGAGVVQFLPSPKNQQISLMAIDDSPLMLAQFQKLLSALGYRVVTCQQAETAIETIFKVMPAAIFIDLNMPGISGFELIKKIRLQPSLAAIPLVILTGEQNLSNRWRAQWSGCEFLTKPLTSQAVRDFRGQLEELLPRLLNRSIPQSSN